MRTTARTTPVTTGARSRRIRSLGGVALGATLLLGCAGARQLTETAALPARDGAERLRALCNTPGQARVGCGVVAASADDLRRPLSVGAVPALPSRDDLVGWAFGVAAASAPVEPPTTTTTAPPATTAPPVTEPPAPPAEEAPAEEPAPEEEQPEETAPPTTRKPKKPAATPAPAPAPQPTAPPATEPPAPPPTEETAPPPPPPAPKVDTSVAGRVVALVNAQRAAAGLGPVSANGALINAAARHSKDQAANDKMSHTGSDGSTMAQRCSAAGYGWSALGENVAAGYGSSESVMNGWMNSAGHRANILNPRFVHIGVAVAYAADGTPYWTMDLGAP
jgi:uncharacterized protein YkwD